MIDMQRMDSVIDVCAEKCQITVEGGVMLTKLNRILEENGMAISVLGAISDITLAGAMATGTHGSGAQYGVLASYVVKLELLTASGEVMTLSREKDEDMFRAAAVSLGALGIILTVTLQCEKAFKLCKTSFTTTMDDVLENLEVHVRSSEHFRFMWIPYTGHVIATHANRTDKKIAVHSSWFWETLVGYHMLEFMLWISTYFTSMVPYIARFMYNILWRHGGEMVDTSYKVFNFNCLFKQYVNEWSIPRSQAVLVLLELQEWILAQEHRLQVHFPIEVRFVKADDLLLSPCSEIDSCYINIIMFRPYGRDTPHQEYWDKYESIMKRAGGRPHWAKAHRETASDLRKMYPHFEQFCNIRSSLDPHGLFLNNYLKRILEYK
ncbi:PREDICTED: L-gulonolactone oxidase-like isoform X2 [Priapulus caudatus]|nr:PREDICTED: L-gulonolactone oxidase-like isoform X2 [Priapulus caudatus]